MGKLFDIDTPFWQGMTKAADLMLLNILTLLFSLPIVTAGAAITALYDAVWKLIRDEGTVWKNFWTAFKSNLKQATVLWLIFAVLGVSVLLGLLLGGRMGNPWLLALDLLLAVIWFGAFSWVFPLQSRFYNPVLGTFRNAFISGIAFLPRTIVMLLLNALPMVLLLFFPSIFLTVGPVWLLIYFSGAAWCCCKLIRAPFEAMIEKIENQDQTA